MRWGFDMTVSAVTPSVLYQGDGLTTVFPFTFPMDETSSLEVVFVDRVTHQITPVSPTDYTTTITSVGGTVTFLVAPAATNNVNIVRTTDTTQLVSVAAQAAYNPQVVEAVWDKLTMLVQEALWGLGTAVKAPPGVDPQTLYNNLLQAWIDAEAARDKARAWAEGATPPDGPGTASAKTHAQAAATSFHNFDKRYLGAHSTPPTLDLNGDPVEAGALYFDTVIDALRAYDGTVWITTSAAGVLLATANLSDVVSPATARSNLESVGYAPGQGLSGQEQADARDNIGLGTAATKDHGTGAGEVPLNSDLGSMAVEDATDYVPKAGSSGLGGFTASGYNLGSLSGTVTPLAANGNFQYGTKGGNFTLAAPATGYYSLQIGVTNTSSTGSLTATGFNKVNGDFRSANSARHLLLINVSGATKVLTIVEAS